MAPLPEFFTSFKLRKHLRIFILTAIAVACSFVIKSYGQNCQTIPTHFKSYPEAIATVKNAHFKISEEVNTFRSSFIKEAHYYSCDGKTGYFIVKIKKREYIYEGMPIALWNGFKNSSSFGTFYNLNIRNKFQMHVN